MNGWRGFNSYYKCMWRAAPGVEYEEMHIGQMHMQGNTKIIIGLLFEEINI